MDRRAVFQPKGKYVVREIGGETILVPVRSGVAELDSVFTLNQVGSVIWSNLSGGRNYEEIVEAVISHFDVSEETALSDSEEFLAALLERGLIEMGSTE